MKCHCTFQTNVDVYFLFFFNFEKLFDKESQEKNIFKNLSKKTLCRIFMTAHYAYLMRIFNLMLRVRFLFYKLNLKFFTSPITFITYINFIFFSQFALFLKYNSPSGLCFLIIKGNKIVYNCRIFSTIAKNFDLKKKFFFFVCRTKFELYLN